jgi:hypothetical protein
MKNKTNNKPVSKGDIWLMPDDFVDKYCTPIIFTVDNVVNDTVTYRSNYSEDIKTMSVSEFTISYKKSK